VVLRDLRRLPELLPPFKHPPLTRVMRAFYLRTRAAAKRELELARGFRCIFIWRALPEVMTCPGKGGYRSDASHALHLLPSRWKKTLRVYLQSRAMPRAPLSSRPSQGVKPRGALVVLFWSCRSRPGSREPPARREQSMYAAGRRRLGRECEEASSSSSSPPSWQRR
jgi:hypothetical protein